MTFFISKAIDFILDTWAISWSHTLNLPCEKWRTMEIFTYNAMCVFIGISNKAGELHGGKGVRPMTKMRWIAITIMHLKCAKINAPPINPRASACF